MLSKANIFFTGSKARLQRISSAILAVFMLQVVAAGFCVSMANAAQVHTASNDMPMSVMQHCATSHMTMEHAEKTMNHHACAHCDMPDFSMTFDKHVFSADDIAVDFVVLGLAATTADVAIATFAHSPPDTPLFYNTLNTYNLNLRIRV